MSDRLTGTYTPGAGDPSPTAVQTDANGNLIVTGGGAGALDIDLKEVNGTTTASGAGAVTAGTLRATLASDDPAVTALQVIDDWDESDRAKVNPIVGQAGIAAGAGAVGVTVPRVTLASDDPAVASLSVVDDWDESDRCKVNLIAGQAGVSAGAGNVDASTIRVTLASNGSLGSCSNTDDAAIGTAGLSIVAKGKTSQRAAVSDGDAVQVVANAYGELVQAGYAWATNSTRAEEINPLSSSYLQEVVASVSNQSAGTYNYYVAMNGYRRLGLQFDLVDWGAGDTIQLYGTMNDDAPASCTYYDITSLLTGGSSTITASGQLLDNLGLASLYKYVRVTVTITGGGAEDYVISAKKVW